MTAATGWRAIDEAPFDTPVEVLVGRRVIVAELRADHTVDADDNSVSQWVCVEGKHPPCWSDGACWASNAELKPSLPPTAWRPWGKRRI